MGGGSLRAHQIKLPVSFDPLPNGRPGTISAADEEHGNKIVHNDWGFRKGDVVTIWRKDGDDKKKNCIHDKDGRPSCS
jgi:hypothetical protein